MRATIAKGLALGALSASLAGVAGASEAVAPTAPAPPPAAVPASHSAAPVSAADTSQLATFAILRRAAQTGDAVPQGVRDHVAQSLAPDVGANPDLARRALRTELGEDLYVVPGRGWVCLVSSYGKAGCTPTDQVARGYSASLQQIPSGWRLRGLVPDGVSAVQVRGRSGETADAEVSNNVWRRDIAFEPGSIAWTRAGSTAEVSVTLTAPPPAPAAETPKP